MAHGRQNQDGDAIAVLTRDHEQVRSLFEQYESLTPRAIKGMADKRDRIVAALAQHAAIEERVLYPVLTELVPELEPLVLESIEEHAMAEQLLAQVAVMDPQDRWFRPKMKVLVENVRHHVEDEESELFPAMREHLDGDQLRELGRSLEEERAEAPTVPPPGAQVRALLDSVTGRAQELLHRLGVGSAA